MTEFFSETLQKKDSEYFMFMVLLMIQNELKQFHLIIWHIKSYLESFKWGDKISYTINMQHSLSLFG